MATASRAGIVETLRAAGCVFAEEEAELILAAARDTDQIAAMVERRVAGHPLEQVVGWVEFCGLRIQLEPGVFVPRRRTELLVDQAAAVAPPRPVVVELCCGSGAVAAALAARLPRAELHAADVDPVAARCARRNLDGVGGQVHQGDLYDALPRTLLGRVDVLVANAPYVPTGEIALMPPEARLHEPQQALDGGPDGVDVHRRIADGARPWLSPGGHLVVETSDRQADATLDAFVQAEFLAEVVHRRDLGATAVWGAAGQTSA